MSNTDYPVQVRLSTVGAGDVKSTLENLSGVARVLQGSLSDANLSGTRMSATFRQTTADGEKYSLTMRRLADTKQQVKKQTDDLSGSMSGMSGIMGNLAIAAGMVYAAFKTVTGVFGPLISQGIELNSLLETSRLGIAATIVSYREYHDEAGKLVTGQAAMNRAMTESANVQKLLQSEAFNTTATLEQMLKAYQQLQIGATAQKASSAELAAFTATLGNFATASGRSFEELSAQTSRVLQGVLTIRNPIVALLRGMGVDNATIKSWVDQGVAIREIQQRLIEFQNIGPEINKTWSGVKSNVQDVIQQMSGAAMQPIQDAAKEMGLAFVSAFTTVREVGGRKITTLSEEVVQYARVMGEALRMAFQGAVEAVGRLFGFFRADASLQEKILLVAEAMAKFKALAGETADFFVLMAKSAQVPLHVAMTMQDLMAGNVAGVKAGLGTLQDLNLGIGEFITGAAKRSKASAESIRQDMQSIRDAMQPRPGEYSFMGPVQPSDNGDPKQKPLDAAIQGTIQQFKDFKALIESKFNLGGLTGLDKALAENEVQFNQNIKTIDAWKKRLSAMSGRELAAAGITDVGGEIANLKSGAARQQLGADQKAFDDAERKYADAYARIGKLASDSKEDQIEASRQVKQQQLADFVEILAANAHTEQEMLDAIKIFNSEKKQINDQAARETSERFQNEMAVLRDQLNAVTLDSYTRERENINKSFDTEVKNIEARYGALSESAKAEIDLARKVRDAKLGLIAEEQASIIGYRKTAEDEAKKIVLSTDSIAGGVALGMAKMKLTIVSTTEAVGEFVSGVWNSLGSAFETGFYDILTGKFDSLKDVLKSLWDSILKDFSKMLSQMLMRWILTGDAMASGQGGGGGVAGWLGGLLGGGNSVYTPGGTGNNGTGTVGLNNSGGIPGLQGGSALANGQQGGGFGGYAATGVAAVGALYTTYEAFKNGFSKTGPTDVSYNGTGLGQSTDFGGNAKFGDFAAAAGAVVAASAMAVSAGLAASAAIVPVWGWIAAAAILIVGAIISIINGPKEGHFYVQIKEAFDKSGARTAIGGFVADVMNTTANFVGELAKTAAGPGAVGKYITAYNKAFKDALGQAAFDFHAGSGEDLNKDVTDFFNKTLPKLAMQAAFGQVGIGQPNGASQLAGMDWNTNNGTMDAAGNWIHHQLFDPNAPIPQLLSGIGFSQDKIGEIATKLSNSSDMEAFKKYLLDLVTIVAGFGDLGARLGRTVAEWQTYFNTQDAAKGTAAEFKTPIANLKDQGMLLDTLTGDAQITAAKTLLQDTGTLMSQMAQALQSIFTMIDNIQKSTASTIQSYRDKLLKPSELESAARDRIAGDFAAITKAANPAEVQAAWQTVMKDLSSVLDAIVARINSITALQQSYADFQTTISNRNKPQFATDPTAWLADNQAAIDAVTTTLATATGDDAVAAAKTLLQLTQDRYNNEVAQLAKINSMIDSITATHDQTNQNLTLQGMGHVETDPKTGKKTWVQDTHAQGEYLKQQYDTLKGQLGAATTPEEVQRIYTQMQGIISQLAAQPQDPEHYAESRSILQRMNDESTRTATDLLKKWGKTLETDLGGVGGQLKAGEKALSTALSDAQKDFEKYLGLMNDASVASTNALNLFAASIVAAMTDLSKYMAHWSFTMSHTADEKDPNWDYEKNEPKGGKTPINVPTTVQSRDVWQDDPTDPTMQVCVSGPSKGQKRVKPTVGGGPGPGHGPDQQPVPPVNVVVTVNSGTPEAIAAAAADAVYDDVYALVDKKQLALVRMLKQNKSILASSR